MCKCLMPQSLSPPWSHWSLWWCTQSGVASSLGQRIFTRMLTHEEAEAAGREQKQDARERALLPGDRAIRAGGTRARGLQETEKPLLQRMHVHENAKPLPALPAAWALSLASLCCFEHSARSRSAALPSAPVRRRSQQRVRASHGLGVGHLPALRARIGAGR